MASFIAVVLTERICWERAERRAEVEDMRRVRSIYCFLLEGHEGGRGGQQ